MSVTLVVLAAGMGSRFGGCKQVEPVDLEGHSLMDFSLYDARRAGFDRAAFIITQEMEAAFRERVGRRIEGYFQVDYVHQDPNLLPEGIALPAGRSKPWGTGHALACCRGVVKEPFAVINADDYYGPSAFSQMHDFLSRQTDERHWAMVGYSLRSTVTDSGSVARGICEVEDGMLRGITERTKIVKRGEDAAYTPDGRLYLPLSGESVVSMNFWGFSPEVLEVLWEEMGPFLQEAVKKDPLGCEYFLPEVVNRQLSQGAVSVAVLPCQETWYGMTYREDLETVRRALSQMKAAGVYPKELWT